VEEPAAILEMPAVIEEEPAVIEEEPAVIEEEPAAIEEEPAANVEAPIVEEPVARLEERPAVIEEPATATTMPEPEPTMAAEAAITPKNVTTPEAKRAPTAKQRPAAKQGPSKRGRKSLKQVGIEADLIEIPTDEVLFSKQYYTMGEVSAMFRVNQSLLRFWETEFDILQPKKNKKGDRYFRPVDIKNLHLIYHLLRQKKYTIEGAKDFLKKNKKADERFEVIQRLEQIKAFLQEMKAQL
jgi:DNA-binding transcriptional MerR regulator